VDTEGPGASKAATQFGTTTGWELRPMDTEQARVAGETSFQAQITALPWSF